MRIFLLSDTHSYIDDNILSYAADADEIWHAGDIGDYAVLQKLEALKPVRSVFGNIDSGDLRRLLPEKLVFETDGLRIAMIHIGGHPQRYSPGVKEWLVSTKPHVFICGHSHILKVVPDSALNLLHLNPGAAGKQGWHKQRTAMRLKLEGGKLNNLEIIEFGKR